MNLCPRSCGILASNDVAGYRYHSCESCNGIWISGAAMHRVLSEDGLNALRTISRDSEGELKCCDCETNCDVLWVEGCKIDLCGRCGGLWLDAGEAERLRHLFPRNSAVVIADESRPQYGPSSQKSPAVEIGGMIGEILVTILISIGR